MTPAACSVPGLQVSVRPRIDRATFVPAATCHDAPRGHTDITQHSVILQARDSRPEGVGSGEDAPVAGRPQQVEPNRLQILVRRRASRVCAARLTLRDDRIPRAPHDTIHLTEGLVGLGWHDTRGGGGAYIRHVACDLPGRCAYSYLSTIDGVAALDPARRYVILFQSEHNRGGKGVNKAHPVAAASHRTSPFFSLSFFD